MATHATEVRSFRIGVLTVQVLSSGGVEGPAVCYSLPVFAYQGWCYYVGNGSMSACQQNSVAYGWMKRRKSKPKQRALCQYYLDWLVGGCLAERIPLPSGAGPPPSDATVAYVGHRGRFFATS